MKDTQIVYKPGFFCVFFWALTWLGMLVGIGSLFFSGEYAAKVMIISWSISGGSAVISYIIRTIEKSRLEGRWSWHWFD